MRGAIAGLILTAAASLAALPAPAATVSVFPVFAYAMPNGDGVASGGTWNYWDRTYSGVGDVTQDAAPLRDGTGKLTDGVVAHGAWFRVSDAAGLGPHVGWTRVSATDPLIRFAFRPPACRCLIRVDGVTIWLDNTQVGGVGAPLDIVVNGVSRAFVPPPPGEFGPVVITNLGLRRGDPTLQFVQDPAYPWTFVSEIAWSGRIVPAAEPPSLAILLSGALGLLLPLRALRPGARGARPAGAPSLG